MQDAMRVFHSTVDPSNQSKAPSTVSLVAIDSVAIVARKLRKEHVLKAIGCELPEEWVLENGIAAEAVREKVT